MELSLPRKEHGELLEELNQEHGFVCKANEIETCIQFPRHEFVSGSLSYSQMRPGMQVQINNIKPLENFIVETQFLESDPFEFNFYLGGYSKGTIYHNRSGITKNIESELQAGQNLMFFGGANSTGVWEVLGQSHSQVVEIYVDPNLIYSFMEDTSQILPSDLHRIIKGEKEATFWQVDIITPAMQMALHQLLGCPYQGMMKQMYLESKALELVVLKLAQIQDTASQARNRKVLKPEDIERIHYAREILLQNIENPPSLLELAKLTGINDYKLKLGFRQVFNTTVFGYLRTYRMERARQLLAEQNIRVSEVAGMVGYSSLSRFNSAFKRQFGVSPSACLGKRLKTI